MKSIFVCFLLACIVTAVVCVCTHKGQKIKDGGKYTVIGQCSILTCESSGKLHALTCPSVFAPPECKEIPEDLSKPYPACCTSYECPK